VDVWTQIISAYSFVCPECGDSSLRVTGLVQHMKRCVRRHKEYFNAHVKCPECKQSVVFERFSYHFRTKHLLVSVLFIFGTQNTVPNCQKYTPTYCFFSDYAHWELGLHRTLKRCCLDVVTTKQNSKTTL